MLKTLTDILNDLINRLIQAVKNFSSNKPKSKNGTGTPGVGLTRGQKFITIGTSVFIFLFSFITFFPTEAIIRHQLRTAGGKGKFTANFEDIELSLFGPIEITNFEYQAADGMTARIAGITADPSFFSLLFNSTYSGPIRLTSVEVNTSEGDQYVMVEADGEMDLEMQKMGKRNVFTGDVDLSFNQIQVPPILIDMKMFNLTTKKTVVNTVKTKFKVKKNKFNIQNFDIASAVLNGNIKGSFEVLPKFKNSRLNLNICAKPTDKLYKDYPIADTFIKGKEAKLCGITLSGSIKKPKTNAKDIFMGSGSDLIGLSGGSDGGGGGSKGGNN